MSELFVEKDLNGSNLNLEIMNTLVKAIEAKDPYTAGHVWRVSQYAQRIGRRLGWKQTRIAWLETEAILHDLGKIGISDSILRKEGPLNDEEFTEIKKHPVIGLRIIESSEFLFQFKHCIESHHERYDGKGYPYGLKKEAIPIKGRIIAVADTFDALTSHRPYRRALSSENAIRIIDEQTGTQFDPDIAKVFIKLWGETHFKDVILHSEPGIPLVACPDHGEIIEITSNTKSGDKAYCPVCKMHFVLERIEEKWVPVMK